MDRISIVVPCFNEEEALPVYYREMKRVMGELSEVSFEILLQELWKRSSYIRGA